MGLQSNSAPDPVPEEDYLIIPPSPSSTESQKIHQLKCPEQMLFEVKS